MPACPRASSTSSAAAAPPPARPSSNTPTSAPSASPAPAKSARSSPSAPPPPSSPSRSKWAARTRRSSSTTPTSTSPSTARSGASFGTTGQRCTATSRILLQKGIAAKFTDEIRRARQGAQSRQRPRRVDRSRSAGQCRPDRNLEQVCRYRPRGRREVSSPAATAHRWRLRQGHVL